MRCITKNHTKKNTDGHNISQYQISQPLVWFRCIQIKTKINYFSISLYEKFNNDPEEYEQFRFHFVPIVKQSKGGNDKYNDCLINCIKKVIQSHKADINPKEIKKFL